MVGKLTQWIKDYSSRLDPLLLPILQKQMESLPSPVLLTEDYSPLPEAAELKPIPVLIQYDEKSDISRLAQPLEKMGLSITYHFKDIHTCSIPVPITQLPTITEIINVNRICFDREITTLLDISTPTLNAPLVWKEYENMGEKATIAIIDTGIAPHPDIESRIIAFHDFVQKRKHPYDDNGHGTHCAGCAAGDGTASNGLYRGTAPKASLVGIKVLDRKGTGSLSTVVYGIQWCIQNRKKHNIRVISLSLGSVAGLPFNEDPVCQIAEIAWKKGITVVAAAGNSGPRSRTITSPGHHPDIITVGASDTQRTIDRSDDQVALFSSRGPTLEGTPKPDIVAPGANIISLQSRASYLAETMQNHVGKHYFVMSGTSMATPMVAGVIALMITKNPHLTPDQIKEQLVKSAISVEGGTSYSQGSGQVDVKGALLLSSGLPDIHPEPKKKNKGKGKSKKKKKKKKKRNVGKK